MTEQLTLPNGDALTLERGVTITAQENQQHTGDNLTVTSHYSKAEQKYFIMSDAGAAFKYENQIDFSLHSSVTQLTNALHQLPPDIAKDVLKLYDLFTKP